MVVSFTSYVTNESAQSDPESDPTTQPPEASERAYLLVALAALSKDDNLPRR